MGSCVPPELKAMIIDRIVNAIIGRWPKHKIKDMLKTDYGISVRHCERFIAEARKVIIERTNVVKTEHIAMSIGTYAEIIRQALKNGNYLTAVKAQQHLDELLGLQAPKAKEQFGAGADQGTPLQIIERIRAKMS